MLRTDVLHGQNASIQWVALALLSALFAGLAFAIRMPAAAMIGPLTAGISISLLGGRIQMPVVLFIAVQGIIGCMIGNSIPLSMMDDLMRQWPLFLLGIVGVLVAGSAVGYQLTRMNFLPGTTAIWGVSPGASTTMILMADSYGADPRLVAIMQQLRVLIVIATAAIVARFGAPATAGAGSSAAVAMPELAAISMAPFLSAIILGVSGAFLATRLRIPGGAMLLPMALAMALHGTEWVKFDLPPWLLSSAYAVVGCGVGLRFTKSVLVNAIKSLPRILISIFALIALCGLLAVAMIVFGNIDPLTAFLATSPGGADTIAIIAASTNVDMKFVVAMQTSRMVVVMIVAPLLSKYVTSYATSRAT